jgi:hypothetical protein
MHGDVQAGVPDRLGGEGEPLGVAEERPDDRRDLGTHRRELGL